MINWDTKKYVDCLVKKYINPVEYELFKQWDNGDLEQITNEKFNDLYKSNLKIKVVESC